MNSSSRAAICIVKPARSRYTNALCSVNTNMA